MELMLDTDTKQVAEPILYETSVHVFIAFLNNLRKLHKIRQYKDNVSNINDV